jgi:hypothetical protein
MASSGREDIAIAVRSALGFRLPNTRTVSSCSALTETFPLAADPVGKSRARALFAPDLAMTFALLTLLALFFMFRGSTALFSDTDTGWHIRNGERILATGSLPQTDPFSFSKPNAPWVAWEWGSDVLMGAIYHLGGLAAVALLYGLCIAASVWMWFRLSLAISGSFLIAGLLFVPMLSTTTVHWLARPHIFSWLFLLGTVWFCERLPRRLEWWHVALVAGATALWVNLHASFLLAPVIAGIYAIGAWLTPLIWESTQTRDWRTYAGLGLAMLPGTLINPSGWNLHRHVIGYLANSALLDRISEFQSFDFRQNGAGWIILCIALCFIGACAALTIRRPERFLLSLLIAAMALRSVRVLPLAALLLLPLACGSITEVLRLAHGLTRALRKRLDDALHYGDRLRSIEKTCGGYAIVPLVAVFIFAAISGNAGFAQGDAPVNAANAVEKLPASARILSTDSFGGYLIFRFAGERKVFFDGRSDFYGTEFTDRYLKMVSVHAGWREEFNRWNFTNALLPADSALAGALEANGWRPLYRDKTAVLLAGRSKL